MGLTGFSRQWCGHCGLSGLTSHALGGQFLGDLAGDACASLQRSSLEIWLQKQYFCWAYQPQSLQSPSQKSLKWKPQKFQPEWSGGNTQAPSCTGLEPSALRVSGSTGLRLRTQHLLPRVCGSHERRRLHSTQHRAWVTPASSGAPPTSLSILLSPASPGLSLTPWTGMQVGPAGWQGVCGCCPVGAPSLSVGTLTPPRDITQPPGCPGHGTDLFLPLVSASEATCPSLWPLGCCARTDLSGLSPPALRIGSFHGVLSSTVPGCCPRPGTLAVPCPHGLPIALGAPCFNPGKIWNLLPWGTELPYSVDEAGKGEAEDQRPWRTEGAGRQPGKAELPSLGFTDSHEVQPPDSFGRCD